MKILFVYNGAESLGIEYLSSFLRSREHETFLLFDPAVFSGEVFVKNRYLAKCFNIDHKIVERAVELKPDLVAFSAYTGNYRWCLRIAQAIRQEFEVPTVFGGVHPTAVPTRVLANDFVDYVIVGEGEHAMLEFVEHLAHDKSNKGLINTPNICLRHEGRIILNPPRPYIRDLDSLPFPDKTLFLAKGSSFRNNCYLIMTSRGCPYNCTYCSNNMYKNLYCDEKNHIRRRSPMNVIEELDYAKTELGIKRVYFMDDVFTLSRSWLEEFVELYRARIELPFFCYSHPLSTTKDIAMLLKTAGCDLVCVGVQSGSERIRNTIYERKDSNERIKQAISYLKDARINVQIDHIFGAPTETKEDLEKSVSLYRDIKPNIILTFWLTYYPRTSIIERAQRFGILTEKDVDNVEEGYVGYTHDVGSVSKEKVPLFLEYELLFRFLAFCHNDTLFSFLSKIIPFVPLKKWISSIFYIIVQLRSFNREYVLKRFFSAFSKHDAP